MDSEFLEGLNHLRALYGTEAVDRTTIYVMRSLIGDEAPELTALLDIAEIALNLSLDAEEGN